MGMMKFVKQLATPRLALAAALLALSANSASAKVAQFLCPFPYDNPAYQGNLVEIDYGARTLRKTFIDRAGNLEPNAYSVAAPADITEQMISAEFGGSAYTEHVTFDRIAKTLRIELDVGPWANPRYSETLSKPCTPYHDPKSKE